MPSRAQPRGHEVQQQVQRQARAESGEDADHHPPVEQGLAPRLARPGCGVGPHYFRELEREDDLPGVLHADELPLVARCGIEPGGEAADVRVAIVGVLAHRVGVPDERPEALVRARLRAVGGRLQHREVAIGIAERRNGDAADGVIDADRLARPVVEQHDPGLGLGERHVVGERVGGLEGRADHLLGRDAVDVFREAADER